MFNPMVNIAALEDFDEKRPLTVRTCWLEKFQSHGWSDHANVYYCKLKLSSAVRGWRGNLDESVRRSWKRFEKSFREEYCKAKTPDSEYYYTTFQRKNEIPRQFHNRLNKIAEKRILTSSLQKLHQGQRARILKDLEHILKQHEVIWSDDRVAHPLKGNGRKAGKNHNRAYNVNEDKAFASDDEQQVLLDQGVEGAHQKVSFEESISDRDVDGLSGDILGGNMMLRKQDVTSEVYRIMENSGWRPPNSEYRSPPKPDFGRPQQTRHWDNCGEGSHSTEFCWADIDVTRRDTLLSIARLTLVRSVTNFTKENAMD
ncbi:LOW QUALITY PROTEIN: hypothetical protein PHMEG_00028976 [Phytophthora megakarya]|uniref:Retrotransposon gag domain-containing protein n=1 Tax=Phytophthora megakarya TaxID=4795 RepID=A0A225V4M5_9STRA|nr:LOW QUALITY PROTEIN: hypothetical protein PHMEG_00028976 [Phytophthora megakarya]